MEENKLLDMVQEIRETVIQMNTNMQYTQKNQDELKSQFNDIKKKLEEQNTETNRKFEEFNNKLLDLNNKYNNTDNRMSKVEKWGNIISTTVFGAILAAILALIIK